MLSGATGRPFVVCGQSRFDPWQRQAFSRHLKAAQIAVSTLALYRWHLVICDQVIYIFLKNRNFRVFFMIIS